MNRLPIRAEAPARAGVCRRLILLGALCLVAAGCSSPRGYLFSYATVPYILPQEDMRDVGARSCRVSITQVKEPVSGLGLSVMWSQGAVMRAMTAAGMTSINYADIETFSILNGVYKRQRLVFYGD